jgi:branched-subunit amino acid transport protein
MSVVVAVLVLGLGTFVVKAAGPVLASGRALPAGLERFVRLVPPALLAALVATGTFGAPGGLVVDARAVGLGVAGIALWFRAPFAVVVLAAAASTALVRALW